MMKRSASRIYYILITAALITTISLITYNTQIKINDIVCVQGPEDQIDCYDKTTIVLDEQDYYRRVEELMKYNSFKNGKWKNLTKEQIGKLSVLGRHLFLQEELPAVKNNKKFKILLWKYGNTIDARHMKRYGSKRHDPFEGCSVQNCEVSYKDEDFSTADIVLIHMHRMTGVKDLPLHEPRQPNQIWAFLTDESPYYTFIVGGRIDKYNGYFNWSMSYRLDSDIPVPYGRTLLKSEDEITDDEFDIKNWMASKNPNVSVAVMGSRCKTYTHRWEYVREMQKYMNVDTYGACGVLKCPGHYTRDCSPLDQYIFYLSFENSNCDEYITEKAWWNAYNKNSIPIVMGGSKLGYKYTLPPNSYINIADFATPRDLTDYIKYLLKHPEELAKYFEWKKYFKIVNEHGFFQSQSFHYCRVCQALNYNDRKRKVYNDLFSFWSIKKDCHPRWDQV